MRAFSVKDPEAATGNHQRIAWKSARSTPTFRAASAFTDDRTASVPGAKSRRRLPLPAKITIETLPALDLDYYKCNVHPIFQRGCGQLACHGTDTGHAFRIYTRGRWRNDQQVQAVTTCLDTGQIVNLQMMATATVISG